MRIRDKEFFILFIIGFTSVFILVGIGYMAVSNWVRQYENYRSGYSNTENFYFHSKNSYGTDSEYAEALESQGYAEVDMQKQAEDLKLCYQDADELVDILSSSGYTTYITDLYLLIGDYGYASVDLVMSYKEPWYRDIKSGAYPDSDGSAGAVIGESLDSYTISMNGKKYIWIGDTYVKVTGIFENYENSGDDYQVAVFFGKRLYEESQYIKDELANELNEDTLWVISGSDKTTEVKNNFAALQSDTLYLGTPGSLLQLSINNISDSRSSNALEIIYNIKSIIICVMLTFCILSCVMLAKVWVVRRRKDFMIMYIYGIKKSQILNMVLRELFEMSAIALMASVIIMIVYVISTDNHIAFLYMWKWAVVMWLVGEIITLGISELSVYIHLNSFLSGEGISE